MRLPTAPGGYHRAVPHSFDPPQQVTIRAYPDGPFLVRGAFALEDCEEGPIPVTRSVVALCRCGRSRRAPLCDGSHRLRGATQPADGVGGDPEP